MVEAECEKSSATTYFWYREALEISNSVSESGGLNWKMTLCLLMAWSVVGLAVIKGIQSSGKVRVRSGQSHNKSCFLPVAEVMLCAPRIVGVNATTAGECLQKSSWVAV